MKMTEEQLKILSDAIDRFGVGHQINKALEEMSELCMELSRIQDKRTTAEKIVEEVADVVVMAAQLALIFGWEDVIDMIKYKVDRLKERMKTQTLMGGGLEGSENDEFNWGHNVPRYHMDGE